MRNRVQLRASDSVRTPTWTIPSISEKHVGDPFLQPLKTGICMSRMLIICARTEVIPNSMKNGDNPNDVPFLTILTCCGMKVAKMPMITMMEKMSFMIDW